MSIQTQTVGVFFGGRSSEHEVAWRSAVFVIKQMPAKYQIQIVAIARSGRMWTLNRHLTEAERAAFTPADAKDLCDGNLPASIKNAELISATVLPCPRAALPEELSQTDHLNRQQSAGPPSLFPIKILNNAIDVAFPVVHGTNGEDGHFQGLFEMAEIAYAGCDIRASVLGIDKDIQKRLAQHGGVPIAAYVAVAQEAWEKTREEIVARVEKTCGYPCFVKPNAQGSAVGVNRARNSTELVSAISAAFQYDTKILVEEAMTGTEVECAFLGTATSPRVTLAGEIAPQDFYSYEEKYAESSAAELFIPARLPPERMQELQKLALKVATILGLEGLARIDFWNCAKTKKFYFNEVNTIPGLTSISMFPKLWEHEGVLGPSWIEELIVRSQTRAQRQAGFSFEPT